MADSSTGVVQLDGIEECRSQCVELLDHALRHIRILSFDLESALWETPDIYERLKHFVLSHEHSQLDIVVQDPEPAIHRGHQLVELARRVPSRINIQVIEPEIIQKMPPKAYFMLVDRSGVLYLSDPKQYHGFCHQDDPATVLRLQDDYDEYHRYSRQSPEFRILSL